MKIRMCKKCGSPVYNYNPPETDRMFFCSSCSEKKDNATTEMVDIEPIHLDNKIKKVVDYLEFAALEASSESVEKACEIDESIQFIAQLPEIIRSALVLAVYAGEDWGQKGRGDDFGFGADGYEYIEKYIEGGRVIHKNYGTKDFYDDFQNFYESYISPKHNSN